MKKVSITVIALFVAIITSFISCTENSTLTSSQDMVKFSNDEVSFLSKLAKEGQILSPEQAATIAMNLSFDRSSTRSDNLHVTKTDVILKGSYNQYGDSILNMLPDTLVYLISTDDGFCTIVPADGRVSTTALGRVPQSQLFDISDDADWTIRDMLYRMFVNATVTEIFEYESKRDSMATILFNKLNIMETPSTRALDDPFINPDDYDFFEVYGPTSNSETIKNSMVPQSWHQSLPYNRFVRYKKPCGTCPAGCAAVAVGQLMAYWGHPSNVDSHLMNWSMVNSQYSYSLSDSLLTGAVDIAYLLQRIGEGIGTDYQCNGSGASLENGVNWLLSHGYQGGSQSGFNYNLVKSSLNNNRPVLIRGFIDDGQGHGWIIDGYRELTQSNTLTIYGIHKITHEQIVFYQGVVYSTYYYLSNNFGNNNPCSWIGSAGYNDNTSFGFTQGDGVFQNNLVIFTEIRPNN